MISGTTVTVIGLGIDVIGALGIAVPDLPGKENVYKLIPGARGKQKAAEAFDESSSRPLPDPDKLAETLKKAWPAIRDSDMGVSSAPFDTVDVSWGSNGHRIEVTVDGGNASLEPGRIPTAVDQYLEKHFRLAGWLLLAIGFVVQIIGVCLSG